ncbi:unnamed protein product [Triticum turgidum subsp. durum]|uniref:U-box domain-containing protein n=1 Tax=Triticum turgidum subsp. durum TaxID=4567 RepID=A0A9R0S633_TRITD|nr:unnamed protein product [Triticum turgidum subsp. durum]
MPCRWPLDHIDRSDPGHTAAHGDPAHAIDATRDALPCGGQVLDIDAALKDGILGCGPEPGDGALGDGGKQPVELRKMMDELDAAGDGGGDEVVPAVFICPISLEPMPAKVSLVVDMLNEGAVDTKINCVRLIRILMEEKGFRPETVASLSLLAGSMRLVRDKRHQDGVAAGLELLNSICAVHRPARSMIVSIGAVQQLVELLPELATECVEPALDILDALASVPEGRTALKDCPRTIPNAVRLLMRVSEACTQRALSMLWVVCRMVPEESAPAALDVGLAAKLLLVIQSGWEKERGGGQRLAAACQPVGARVAWPGKQAGHVGKPR